MSDSRLPARRAAAADVRPLRTAILRPTWADLATYPEDDLADTLHVAAERAGAVVAVATLYAERPPEGLRSLIPGPAYARGAAVRLRGMATAEAVRGAGYGAAVLREGARLAQAGGAAYLWCNARLLAVPFYRRLGLHAVGDEFAIAGIGPHVVMWGPLAAVAG